MRRDGVWIWGVLVLLGFVAADGPIMQYTFQSTLVDSVSGISMNFDDGPPTFTTSECGLGIDLTNTDGIYLPSNQLTSSLSGFTIILKFALSVTSDNKIYPVLSMGDTCDRFLSATVQNANMTVSWIGGSNNVSIPLLLGVDLHTVTFVNNNVTNSLTVYYLSSSYSMDISQVTHTAGEQIRLGYHPACAGYGYSNASFFMVDEFVIYDVTFTSTDVYTTNLTICRDTERIVTTCGVNLKIQNTNVTLSTFLQTESTCFTLYGTNVTIRGGSATCLNSSGCPKMVVLENPVGISVISVAFNSGSLFVSSSLMLGVVTVGACLFMGPSAGVHSESYGLTFFIYGCQFTANNVPVFLQSASSVRLRLNTVSASVLVGFLVVGENTTISNNTFTSFGGTAMQITSAYATISGNEISGVIQGATITNALLLSPTGGTWLLDSNSIDSVTFTNQHKDSVAVVEITCNVKEGALILRNNTISTSVFTGCYGTASSVSISQCANVTLEINTITNLESQIWDTACPYRPVITGILMRSSAATSTGNQINSISAFAQVSYGSPGLPDCPISAAAVVMIDTVSTSTSDHVGFVAGSSISQCIEREGCGDTSALPVVGVAVCSSAPGKSIATFNNLVVSSLVGGNAAPMSVQGPHANGGSAYGVYSSYNGSASLVPNTQSIFQTLAGGIGGTYDGTTDCSGGIAAPSNFYLGDPRFIISGGLTGGPGCLMTGNITRCGYYANYANTELVLEMDLPYTTPLGGSTCVFIANANNITINGMNRKIECTLSDRCPPGISVYNSNDVRITNIVLSHAELDIQEKVKDIVVSNALIENTLYAINSPSYVSVINTVIRNAFRGVYMYNCGATPVIISGSSFTNVQQGLVILGQGCNVNVSGNTFDDVASAISATQIYGIVAGNTILHSNTSPIAVSKASGFDLVVSGNTIRDSYYLETGQSALDAMYLTCDQTGLISVTDNYIANFTLERLGCFLLRYPSGMFLGGCNFKLKNNTVTNFYYKGICMVATGIYIQDSQGTATDTTISHLTTEPVSYPEPFLLFPNAFVYAGSGICINSSDVSLPMQVNIENAVISDFQVINTPGCYYCDANAGLSAIGILAIAPSVTANLTSVTVTGLKAGTASTHVYPKEGIYFKGFGGDATAFYGIGGAHFILNSCNVFNITAGNGGNFLAVDNSLCYGGIALSYGGNSTIVSYNLVANQLTNGTSCVSPCNKVCEIGYVCNGTECADLNECDYGVCDPHVTCTNTIGNFSCGPCPFGYIATFNNKCYALCGDGTCEPSYNETCVSCPLDCHNATCNACGDGVCDPKENCNNCFEDCKSTCAPPTPCPGTPVCTNHGKCVESVCVCVGNYTGPDCSVLTRPLNLTTGQNSSQVTVTVSPTVSFNIGLTKLQELSSDGVLSEVDATTLSYNTSTNDTIASTIYVFSALLGNGANLTVTIYYFKTSTVYTFVNTSSTFAANTVKINVNVVNWPFKSIRNSLDLIFGANSTGHTPSCVTSQKDGGGSVQWVLITVNGITMYGTFLATALVDGKQRNITFSLLSDNSVSASVPHFWVGAEMDPSYSVLIQTTSQDACGYYDKKNKNINKILIGVLVTFGVLVILAIAAYFLIPRWRIARKVRRAGNSQNSTGEELREQKLGKRKAGKGKKGAVEVPESPRELEIEKANDMHVSTVAGNFVVRM